MSQAPTDIIAASERVIVVAIHPCELKQVVMDAYLDGFIDAESVEAVFADYGLEHD